MTNKKILELFKILRLVLVEDSMNNVELELFFNPISKVCAKRGDKFLQTTGSVEWAAEILEETLRLQLEVSKQIANLMGKHLKSINLILDYGREVHDKKVNLHSSVVIALASCCNSQCSQIEKFRFVKHFWGTIFHKDNLPDIILRKISKQHLEEEVSHAGIIEEKKVLRAIIERMNAYIKAHQWQTDVYRLL